jgi:ribonuclease VapC
MIVETRYGSEGIRDLDLFINKAQIELIAVDVEQAHLARQAFRQFGKGRHAAGLNFGDCFSYALARALSDSLLYKGSGFGKCDIDSHPASRRPQ